MALLREESNFSPCITVRYKIFVDLNFNKKLQTGIFTFHELGKYNYTVACDNL